MTDIVERLRAIRDGEEIERLATEIEQLRDDTQMLWDAVAKKNAEIERLRHEVRRLEDALETRRRFHARQQRIAP